MYGCPTLFHPNVPPPQSQPQQSDGISQGHLGGRVTRRMVCRTMHQDLAAWRLPCPTQRSPTQRGHFPDPHSVWRKWNISTEAVFRPTPAALYRALSYPWWRSSCHCINTHRPAPEVHPHSSSRRRRPAHSEPKRKKLLCKIAVNCRNTAAVHRSYPLISWSLPTSLNNPSNPQRQPSVNTLLQRRTRLRTTNCFPAEK